MPKPLIKIDVVSDVVCPWCYIGKRRLEKALDQLSSEYDFEVVYHPFELNPNTPVEGFDQKEYLSEKFGGSEQYDLITGRTANVAASEGLTFHFDQQLRSPNTRKAHALIQAAKNEDKQLEVTEAFFKAYFTDAIDLTKDENLLTVAVNAGVSRHLAEQTLTDATLLAEIAERENELQGLGIRGVPFYIIDNQYGISGAQSPETFIKALKEVGEKVAAGESCDIDKGEC